MSGEPNCDSDNAIGVAYSASPTGPWTFSDTPVVGPRRGGGGCNFLWTYDPDVLGDSIGTKSILYYGSYYGGIYAADLTLNRTGATATTIGQVAIDNKYEGANVIYRDGYYYLFVSATNCCNGALTGYSVFVGRSTEPARPVRRPAGQLADRRPGRRHAVPHDERQPLGRHRPQHGVPGRERRLVDDLPRRRPAGPVLRVAVGFTKRPALLDAIDWVNGWPTVNGGTGRVRPQRCPRPPARRARCPVTSTQLVKPQDPHGCSTATPTSSPATSLSSDWSWEAGANAPANPPTVTVANGVLSLEMQHADLYVDSNNASVLVRDAPAGDYVVETKVRFSVPGRGCCYNYAQAGLMVYDDDDNYVKLTEHLHLEHPADRVRQGDQPGARGLGPLRQHGGRAPVGGVDLPAHRRRAPHRRGERGSWRRHRALHRVHQPGRPDVGSGWHLDPLARHRRPDRSRCLRSHRRAQTFTADFDYVRVYSLKESASSR